MQESCGYKNLAEEILVIYIGLTNNLSVNINFQALATFIFSMKHSHQKQQDCSTYCHIEPSNCSEMVHNYVGGDDWKPCKHNHVSNNRVSTDINFSND